MQTVVMNIDFPYQDLHKLIDKKIKYTILDVYNVTRIRIYLHKTQIVS
jgi:hypothetical protein